MKARACPALIVGISLLIACRGVAGAVEPRGRDATANLLTPQAPRIVGPYEKLEITVPFETFHDVHWTHWAFGEVEACARAQITLGYLDGTYQPERPVDRALMATFIARGMAGGDANVPEVITEPTFSDVSADYWAFKYIEYIAANGVSIGYPDGTYRPDLIVDRGQMGVFIARTIATPAGEAGLVDYVPPETPTFDDVTPDSDWAWCHKYVEYVAAEGITQGYEDGLYHPELVCSRDQKAVYVSRAFDLEVIRPDPFDPAQIDVVGVFHTPSGSTITLPGFYYRPYERSRDERGHEVLTASGRGVFKIRFASDDEIGTYTYEVTVTDAWGERVEESGSFEVAVLEDPGSLGCVRRSATAPFYFEFDSGDSYFAIGENLCWPSACGTYDYDYLMGRLHASGANYIRLILANDWNPLYLEHVSWELGDGNGLGRCDQEAAWRIDYILDLAHLLGIEVHMCFDTHASFVPLAVWEWGRWDTNPYNAVNGGPCANPMDFLTTPAANDLFKRRLRYIVARWGYETALLAWELLAEVDGVPGYDSASVAAWHQEMATYLRGLDPWDHLITASFGLAGTDPVVDGLDELDFVQSHSYGSQDIADMIEGVCRDKTEAYRKPHYVSEFGFDEDSMRLGRDPDGIHFHNGLWSSVLSGAAGAAMHWWWGNYVEPNDLYYHFAALAAYTLHVDWVQESYEPGDVLDIRWAPAYGTPAWYAPRAAYPRTDYATAPNLRVLALSNSTSALLWVQNKDHTWWNDELGLDPEPVDSSEVELAGFAPGDYEIQEWNTYTGAVTYAYLYTSTDGNIVVTTPSGLATDVAYKIRPTEP